MGAALAALVVFLRVGTHIHRTRVSERARERERERGEREREREKRVSHLLVGVRAALAALVVILRVGRDSCLVISASSHDSAIFRGGGGHFSGRMARLATRQGLLNVPAQHTVQL